MRSDPISDRGDVMLWVVVALPALLSGLLVLVSATQYWEMRREAGAVAAVAARAGAQGDGLTLRAGFDGESPAERLAAEDRSRERATAVVEATNETRGPNYETVVIIEGGVVTVRVAAEAHYTFFSFGMPRTVHGSSTATALEGTTSGYRR